MKWYKVMIKSFCKKKVLHRGQVFKSVANFSTGILPTKRQVIEWLLHEDNFLLSAARIFANELEKRWLWCNIYCHHPLTITKQLQNLIKKFSMLDR